MQTIEGRLRRSRWGNLIALALAVGVPSVAAGAGGNDGPLRLAFELKAKHYDALAAQRDADLATSQAVASSHDYVPATARIEDRRVAVELRVGGEYPDSTQGGKWPLHLRVRGEDHILGMRRLAVRAPATRAFQAEALVLEHMRREGVLAPRYRFVQVTLGSAELGVMALEERFSKELLESQQRREGVVFRLRDAGPGGRRTADARALFDGIFRAEVHPHRDARVAKVESLSDGLETARSLLHAFLRGDLPAEQVFDLEMHARFLAVAELWQSQPLLDWRNLRLYFNPITQRLEPVAHSADLRTPPLESGLATRSQAWSLLLLESPLLRERFLASLRRIAAGFAKEPGRRWLRHVEGPLLAALQPEYPLQPRYDLSALTARGRSLAQLDEAGFAASGPIAPGAEGPYPVRVRAFHKRDERGEFLEIANQQPRPLALSALFLRDPESALEIGLDPLGAQSLPVPLPPLGPGGAPVRVRVDFVPPPGGPLARELGGRVRVEGESAEGFRALPLEAAAAEGNPIPQASLEEVLASHSFLEWDAEALALRAPPGVWNVKGSLVLPEGVGLELGPGTTLRFAPGQMLLAHGPLVFQGRPERPVVLEGLPDPTGPGRWQGIAALASDRPHRWLWVVVRNTTGIERDRWQLDAGVTLRNAKVELRATSLRGNRSEDALNLIGCDFELRDLSIVDTPSDGLDADFSDGQIRGGHFSRIGGDAIDVSGAEVQVEGVRLEDVGDKAISVGEESRLAGRRLTILRSGTGVASKDGSVADIEDSQLSEVRHAALMAYIKKPEYGASQLDARNCQMSDFGRLAVVQVGSRVSVDGAQQPPEEVDIDAFYESGYMKK